MSDIDVYAEADQLVKRLSDLQCDAVAAAIYARANEHELARGRPRIPAVAATVSPARRKVGLFEAIRGPVECCDPLVTAQWQLWRLCAYFVACIFLVVLVLGLLFGKLGVIAAIGTACILSTVLSFRMTQGKASVCH